MAYKVSILTPVYKAEKYIEATVRSLMEQTYGDIEYLFVDDCSPDSSVSIIERTVADYPKRQQQVKILRKEHNEGVGLARQSLIDNATGEFVMFADADDILPKGAVEECVRVQMESNADMVNGASMTFTSEGDSKPQLPFHGPKKKIISRLLVHNTEHNALWSRLIRRSLFTDNGIGWDGNINMGEDLAVMPCLSFVAKSIATTDEIVYKYRVDRIGEFSEGNQNVKHFGSFQRANDYIRDFFLRNDTKREYSTPLHIGLMEPRYKKLLLSGSRFKGELLHMAFLIRKRLFLTFL